MNEKHFDQLKANNLLSDDLARRIEASAAKARRSVAWPHSRLCLHRRRFGPCPAAEVSPRQEKQRRASGVVARKRVICVRLDR